jgi:hypothetical protein
MALLSLFNDPRSTSVDFLIILQNRQSTKINDEIIRATIKKPGTSSLIFSCKKKDSLVESNVGDVISPLGDNYKD